MVDVNRIRERAADWLGDVGDAALRAVTRRVRGERGASPRGRTIEQLVRDLHAAPPDDDAATDPAGPIDMQRMQDEIAEAAGCVRSVEPGPWRGVEHTVHESRLGSASWIVGPDSGPVMVASFSGLHAEARAREYAALMSAPLPCTAVLLAGQDNAADNGVWCDRHGGRLVDAAPSSGAQGVPLADGVETWIGQPSRDLAAAWNKHAGIVTKPAAVALCHRWSCVGVEGELEVVRVDLSGGTCNVGLAPVGSAEVTVRARQADMLGLKEWRFLG